MDWAGAGIVSSDADPASITGLEEWQAWEDAQVSRLDEALGACGSRWSIVVGHHPVYSYSTDHGSTKELSRLNDVMRAHGVAAYLNGHDHNLQACFVPLNPKP